MGSLKRAGPRLHYAVEQASKMSTKAQIQPAMNPNPNPNPLRGFKQLCRGMLRNKQAGAHVPDPTCSNPRINANKGSLGEVILYRGIFQLQAVFGHCISGRMGVFQHILSPKLWGNSGLEIPNFKGIKHPCERLIWGRIAPIP